MNTPARRKCGAAILPAVTGISPAGCRRCFSWSGAIVLWLALTATTAFAAAEETAIASDEAFSWAEMFMYLFGGLALFLFGMEQMADGLKSAAGNKMKTILARFTTNRVKAALTGGVVTALIQSSSVTTVLVVGFVSAGLMTLTQSVGVIMGANAGTTITAQIVAFQVGKAALVLVALGFAMLFVAKKDAVKQTGNIVMGLGFIFFGMDMMSDAMRPLRTYEPFIDLMANMGNPLLGILAGALFTALVQSSSATTGIVIALASQGLLELPAGIALIFGANIGTCVTAWLASLGKSREAMRVAMVHVIFNVVGVLLWVAFIPYLAEFVRGMSPVSADLEGSARLAAEMPRQVANAHAVFNIANTMLMLPFAGLIAALVLKIAPDRPEEPVIKAEFLDRDAMTVPSLALQNARLETARLGDVVWVMLQKMPGAFLSGKAELLDEIEAEDDRADILEGEILRYLGELRKGDLTDEESRAFQGLMTAVDSLESIGDVVAEDLVEIGRRRLEKGTHPSDTMRDMLRKLFDTVSDALGDAIVAVREEKGEAADAVLYRKHELDRLVENVLRHQEERFREVSEDRLEVFRMEMRMVEKMRRIYTFTKRIARTMRPKE